MVFLIRADIIEELTIECYVDNHVQNGQQWAAYQQYQLLSLQRHVAINIKV